MRRLRLIRRMKITCTALVLLIQTLQCLASDDSPFQLTNKDTGFCLIKTNNDCNDLRWTTGDRLLVLQTKKCLGVQGKSVGSEINRYDCDEKSDLQRWECKNGTVLALKDQELYVELTADSTAVLSKTIRPNNQLTITGTSNGACARTYRAKEGWTVHPTTGAYYQLNTQSAVTQPQAEASCMQQGAALLSITDPHQQAYVTGHPLPNPGHNCAILDPAVQYSWQSVPCSKKLGYICYSEVAEIPPAQAGVAGFCSSPWIFYNGHCFHLNRTQKTWPDAQRACRNDGGDLVSISNVEDQSFVISQLGYISTDELWIGLNDRKTERLFEWSDHSTVMFTSWDFGKPAVSTDIKDCVLIRGENGNWDDRVCEEKRGSICMKTSASKASGDEVRQDVGCKTGWIRYGSYCYFIGTQTKTFDEAKNDCRTLDSNLADVSNRVDNAFLVSLVGLRPEKYFWLGLSNRKNINEFAWINTNLVKYTHWNTHMPGHLQGCVAMTTGFLAGLWDLLPCTNKEKYICKHLAEGAVVTPAPPSLNATICEKGWTRIGLRNFCNKVFTGIKKRTWFEARDYCKVIGGDLLSVHSADELKSIPDRYRVTPNPPPDPVAPEYNKTSDGWLEWNGAQYYFNNRQSKAMEEARSSCQQMHSDLVVINSEAESVFLWKQCYSIINDQKETWHGARTQCKAKGGNLASILSREVQDISIPDSPEPPMTDYVNIFNDSFKLVSQQMTWGAAKKNCESDGAKLASLRSQWSEIYVELLALKVKSPMWIGLNKIETAGYFRYIDGWRIVRTNWGSRQPRPNRPCVFVDLEGKWNTADCDQKMSSVCMKSTGKTHVWKWLDKSAMDYTNWRPLDQSSSTYGSMTATDGTWVTGHRWYDRGYICKSPKRKPKLEHQSRGRNILPVVLVITVIAIGAAVGLFLFKRSGRRLSIPKKLSTFDNPLFSNNERYQPDTSELVPNAEEENPAGPALAV
ncbi:Macrophage mannose receptor 1 [Liparis tanakae]|uniref:Macrophage mannose receptor 1 n=1 Tax=Liparis tanakae TaxID=230148 RepID=A0A4Z2GQ89_9TELE|nr:Macrophage mannose receptor 1 [Liparis tanakae]